jgi:hypothetical protein
MGYIRRKMKISRRVKRTKTKNTRKRKQKRNRAFRKSRRVYRGGTRKRSRGAMEDNWQEDTRTKKEKSEQNAIENKKDKKNELKRVANIKKNMYLEPLGKGVAVDQTEQLDLTEKQQGLMDDIDAESEGEEEDLKGGPISFGGKKKRAIKKK